MKADMKTHAEVTQTLKGMLEAYKKHDLQGVLSFWAPDPDVLVIGLGAEKKSAGLAQFGESLKQDWAQSEVMAINVKGFAVSASELVSWVTADITFHGRKSGEEFDLPGCLTGVLEKRYGKWLWAQLHFSAVH
jgi:ketosteroid isomerase-like protein